MSSSSLCTCRMLVKFHPTLRSPKKQAFSRRNAILVVAQNRSFASNNSTQYKLDATTGRILLNTGNDNNDNKPVFQTIIGLEIHAQLAISTKLFSTGTVTDQNVLHLKPNSLPYWHPLDVAVPGYLPVLSQEAVHKAVLAASLLNCEICQVSRFERKHYTYADLPFHYQVTQQRWPLAVNGRIETFLTPETHLGGNKKKKKNSAVVDDNQDDDAETVTCRIHRIQLEQDTGKTIQGTASFTSSNSTIMHGYQTSCVDFNRSGQALIEIVLEPDLRTPQQASAVTDAIRQLLMHANICNGRMQEGSFRCDVNVNIEEIPSSSSEEEDEKTVGRDDAARPLLQRKRHKKKRSPRVEVKNLNSLKQIRDSIEYEVIRQAHEWKEHNRYNTQQIATSTTTTAGSETRTWNPAMKVTELIRQKDQEQDYRFLPEPDLPPLVLDSAVLNGMDLATFLETHKPELPSQAVERLQRDYGISEYQATLIVTGDLAAIAFFEQAVETAKHELKFIDDDDNDDTVRRALLRRVHDLAAGFITRDLFGLIKEKPAATNDSDTDEHDKTEASIHDSRVSSRQLGQVIALLLTKKFSYTTAGYLLKVLYLEEPQGADPAQVAAKRGLELITDRTFLERICHQVITDNPKQWKQYLRRGGKRGEESKAVQFFTGTAMIACNRNADPETLVQILEQVLQERKEQEKKGDSN